MADVCARWLPEPTLTVVSWSLNCSGRGDVSLKEVTALAFRAGLRHPRSGRRMTKSEIHRILHNPIYSGDFNWNGKLYRGVHSPLISRRLFETVQDVFKLQLQQRHMAIQNKLDRAYDDRLTGKITEDMWSRKSAE